MRVLVALNILVALRTYGFFEHTSRRIIVQRKYIVNTSGEFHFISQLREMPRAYGSMHFL